MHIFLHAFKCMILKWFFLLDYASRCIYHQYYLFPKVSWKWYVNELEAQFKAFRKASLLFSQLSGIFCLKLNYFSVPLQSVPFHYVSGLYCKAGIQRLGLLPASPAVSTGQWSCLFTQQRKCHQREAWSGFHGNVFYNKTKTKNISAPCPWSSLP